MGNGSSLTCCVADVREERPRALFDSIVDRNAEGTPAGPKPPGVKPPKQVKPDLCIIHFNDVYHIQENKKREPAGGAARFKTAVEEARRKAAVPPLLLFSGDIFNPSLLSTVTKGKHMLPILQSLQVDVACLGNHDFDFGVDELVKLLKGCPDVVWVMTNVTDGRTGFAIAGARRYHIVQSGEARIGILGIVEQEWMTTIRDLPSYVQYEDKMEYARKYCRMLRKEERCNFIIALTHMREPNDCELAERIPEIDLILGGHDHFFRESMVNGTKVVKSGTDFKQLSTIDVFLSHDNRNVTPYVEVQRVDITKQFEPDAALGDIVLGFEKELDDKLQKELCRIEAPINVLTECVRTEEVAFGNFVADVMRAEFDSDCSLVNSGILRADIIFEPGVLTLKDLVDIIPIEDVVIKISIKGKYIFEALECAVSKYPAHEGRFPLMSGIRVAFDKSKPPMSRITDARICKRRARRGDSYVWCTLSPRDEEVYTMSTSIFVANGNDGFSPMTKKERFEVDEENGRILPQIVRQAIEKLVPADVQHERKTSISKAKQEYIEPLYRKASIASIKKKYLPVLKCFIEERIIIGEGDSAVLTQERVSYSFGDFGAAVSRSSSSSSMGSQSSRKSKPRQGVMRVSVQTAGGEEMSTTEQLLGDLEPRRESPHLGIPSNYNRRSSTTRISKKHTMSNLLDHNHSADGPHESEFESIDESGSMMEVPSQFYGNEDEKSPLLRDVTSQEILTYPKSAESFDVGFHQSPIPGGPGGDHRIWIPLPNIRNPFPPPV